MNDDQPDMRQGTPQALAEKGMHALMTKILQFQLLFGPELTIRFLENVVAELKVNPNLKPPPPEEIQ